MKKRILLGALFLTIGLLSVTAIACPIGCYEIVDETCITGTSTEDFYDDIELIHPSQFICLETRGTIKCEQIDPSESPAPC